jgi:hypothetical protein
MRKLGAVAVLLLSGHAALADNGDERAALFDAMSGLKTRAWFSAYLYLECTDAAAKEAANADKASPAAWMADWAATEAAKQCSTEGRALIAGAGARKGKRLKAMVHRANVETALEVRRGGPLIAIAPAGQTKP